MKKLIRRTALWHLILSFLLNCFTCTVTFAQENSDISDSEQKPFEFLQAVGVFDDEDTYAENEQITRGHFVKLALNTINYKAGEFDAARCPFTDVNAETKYGAYITAAYELNYISGGGDLKFEPEEPITFAAAIKILCCVLGYSTFAEHRGGYPVGYMDCANRYGLLDGINVSAFENDTSLTANIVMQILKNAMLADVFEMKTYGERNEISKDEKNLLAIYFSVYKTRGVVCANVYTDLLAPDSGLKRGQIKIDNRIYEYSQTAEDLLGYEVDAYYHMTDRGTVKDILYIESTNHNNILTLNADNIVNDSDLKYENKNGRLDNIHVNPLASIIVNGKFSSMSLKDALKVDKGICKFISNDGDKAADVVVIESYKTMIVDGVSTGEPTGISSNGKFLSIDNDSDNDSKLVNEIVKNGISIELNDIACDNVLLVAESNGDGLNKRKIIVSDNVVYGHIDRIFDDSIKVEEKEYKYDKTLFPNLKVGAEYKLLFDSLNNLCYAKKINDIVYGYLYGIEKYAFDNVRCRIFTENSHWVDLEFNDKVKFSSDVYKNESLSEGKVYDILAGDPNGYRQLIRYSVNGSGVLTRLETAHSITVDTEDETTAVRDDVFRMCYNGNSTWRNASKSFDGIFTVDLDTKVFVVPQSGKQEEFSVRSNSIFGADASYSIKIYDTDLMLRPKAMIVENYKSGIGNTNKFLIVDGLCTLLNNEGVPSEGIEGFWSGHKISLAVRISSELTKQFLSDLKKGDIIQYTMNDFDEITEISLHRADEYGYYIKNQFYSKYTVIGAVVKECDYEDKHFRVCYKPNVSGVVYANSNTGVYIYDSMSNTCSIGSINDIVPGDRMYTSMRYLLCNEIIILR